MHKILDDSDAYQGKRIKTLSPFESKVYKVNKVRNPAGAYHGSQAANKPYLKDTRDFTNFIDLMDFMN